MDFSRPYLVVRAKFSFRLQMFYSLISNNYVYCICLTHKWVINAKRHKTISKCWSLWNLNKLPEWNMLRCLNCELTWSVFGFKPWKRFRTIVEVQLSLVILGKHKTHWMPTPTDFKLYRTTKYVSIYERTKWLPKNIHKFTINARDLWFPHSFYVPSKLKSIVLNIVHSRLYSNSEAILCTN